MPIDSGLINTLFFLPCDTIGQTNKGIAYIDYDTRAEAERAISYMDGVCIVLLHRIIYY